MNIAGIIRPTRYYFVFYPHKKKAILLIPIPHIVLANPTGLFVARSMQSKLNTSTESNQRGKTLLKRHYKSFWGLLHPASSN